MTTAQPLFFSSSSDKTAILGGMNPTNSTAEVDKFYLKINGKAVGISKAPIESLQTAAKDLEVAKPGSHLLLAIQVELERRQEL